MSILSSILPVLYTPDPVFGQAEFTSTTTWTVPDGVTSISVVILGGGGGSAENCGGGSFSYWWASGGGGGGGLSYQNNIPVTPGEELTVEIAVPSKATYQRYNASTINDADMWANNSYLKRGEDILVHAGGGHHAVYDYGTRPYTSSPNYLESPSGYTRYSAPGGSGGVTLGYDGGGDGGNGGSNIAGYGSDTYYGVGAGGGGGAGGYSGNGGNGGAGTNTNTNPAGTSGQGGAGGGGSGGAWRTGGGVGLYGEGDSGGSNQGGSGGLNSSFGTISAPPPGTGASNDDDTGSYLNGYYYNSTCRSGRNGGRGACRIIWGVTRAFPSSGTEDF